MLLLLANSTLAQPAMVEAQPVTEVRARIGTPLIASVEAVMRSRLAAEEEGRIEKRAFDEGDRVEAGSELLWIDTTLRRVDLNRALAMVEVSQTEIRTARIEFERAEREAVRIGSMFERGASPEKELLDARTALERARGLLATAEATLAERKASVARLETEISKCVIRAPFSGRIARRSAEVGGWVNRGDVVAELVQIDPLYVTASVPESLVSRLKLGATAAVSFDALAGAEREAVVVQILPEADESSRTLRVRLQMENDDEAIRPGFFARLSLLSDEQTSIGVPADAIVRQGPMAMVMVIRGGVAQPVPVTVGATAGDRVMVSGDLKPGELVVTRGNESLRPGSPVAPTNLGPPPGPPGGPPGSSPDSPGAPPAPTTNDPSAKPQ